MKIYIAASLVLAAVAAFLPVASAGLADDIQAHHKDATEAYYNHCVSSAGEGQLHVDNCKQGECEDDVCATMLEDQCDTCLEKMNNLRYDTDKLEAKVKRMMDKKCLGRPGNKKCVQLTSFMETHRDSMDKVKALEHEICQIAENPSILCNSTGNNETEPEIEESDDEDQEVAKLAALENVIYECGQVDLYKQKGKMNIESLNIENELKIQDSLQAVKDAEAECNQRQRGRRLVADVDEVPSSSPSSLPSLEPSSEPSETASETPSSLPSLQPSGSPSESPQPSSDPSSSPSSLPSLDPSSEPSETASETPSSLPSLQPSGSPTSDESPHPSSSPSSLPSLDPSSEPSETASETPSSLPSLQPSDSPSESPQPSSDPSSSPSSLPSLEPSSEPSETASETPSSLPSLQPSGSPSGESPHPSSSPSSLPSLDPSSEPSETRSETPSSLPSLQPSGSPSESPQPSSDPSSSPSSLPSLDPSSEPSESASETPSSLPSLQPSGSPSESPQSSPSRWNKKPKRNPKEVPKGPKKKSEKNQEDSEEETETDSQEETEENSQVKDDAKIDFAPALVSGTAIEPAVCQNMIDKQQEHDDLVVALQMKLKEMEDVWNENVAEQQLKCNDMCSSLHALGGGNNSTHCGDRFRNLRRRGLL